MSTTTTRLAVLHTDGCALNNPGPAGAGAVLVLEDGSRHTLTMPLGETTNNVAESFAILLGINLAYEHGVTHLTVRSDSQLIVKQLNGEYQCRDKDLAYLQDTIKLTAAYLEEVTYEWVPREQNRDADALSKQAARAN